MNNIDYKARIAVWPNSNSLTGYSFQLHFHLTSEMKTWQMCESSALHLSLSTKCWAWYPEHLTSSTPCHEKLRTNPPWGVQCCFFPIYFFLYLRAFFVLFFAALLLKIWMLSFGYHIPFPLCACFPPGAIQNILARQENPSIHSPQWVAHSTPIDHKCTHLILQTYNCIRVPAKWQPGILDHPPRRLT